MIPFAGRVWRVVRRGQSPARPAGPPEGRFHHDGQFALYASLSVEGTAVAIRRYLRPDDPPRVVHALDLRLLRVADHRGDPGLSVVWQDSRAAGAPAPTWVMSDAARAAGAQGLLYSSRSRPDLDHLVLFDPAPEVITAIGPALPFDGAM